MAATVHVELVDASTGATLAIHSPGVPFAPGVVQCLVPFARAAHLGVVDWCQAARFALDGGSA